jgi:hypothetical protein
MHVWPARPEKIVHRGTPTSLHGALDEHIADRRVHPDSADGWHHRRPVSRICGDALDRHPGVVAVSLTTTPMMCALLLRRPQREGAAHWCRLTERSFEALQRGYAGSLTFALNHRPLIVLILAITLCLNFYLYVSIPKGFFPQQDTGRINGSIQPTRASRSSSCGRSYKSSSRSFDAIRRSIPWSDLPVPDRPMAASSLCP